jgi:acetoin utilization protein AcuA
MELRIEQLKTVQHVDIVPGFFAVTRSGELREMLLRILDLDATVFAALQGSLLVGYTADLSFAPIEYGGTSWARRWQRLADVRELGAIEVARGFRGHGLARRLLEAQVAGPRLDGQILIGEGLSWHWDCEGRGLTLSDCRASLLALFRQAGFAKYQTDEPEVSYSLANFLVGRIGPRVPEASRLAFESALFER